MTALYHNKGEHSYIISLNVRFVNRNKEAPPDEPIVLPAVLCPKTIEGCDYIISRPHYFVKRNDVYAHI